MDFVAKTDVGKKRENNEDNYYVKMYNENLALVIVADGLGGYESGEVASKMLTDIFSKYIDENIEKLKKFDEKKIEKFLKDTLNKSNQLIYDLEKTDAKYKGMGTTVVLVVKVNDKIYYFSVGDSRIYYVDNKLSSVNQITEDDTYVNELIKTNIIDKADADTHPKKHILTKAVGVFKEIEFKINTFDKRDGYLILCSDGLYNMITSEEIINIFSKNKFENLAEKLVSRANENGGNDNITVVIIKL